MAPTRQNPQPIPKKLSPSPQNTKPILRSGQEAVAYHIPTHPSTPKTTIALPRYSTWTSGLHFHTTHTEYLRLVRGSIFAEVNGETKILSAAVGGEVNVYSATQDREAQNDKERGVVIEVPKYARHNWGRADSYLRRTRRRIAPRSLNLPPDVEEEVVVEEWTDPSDLEKPLFFWNLNGIITGTSPDGVQVPQLSWIQSIVKKVLGEWWVPLQLFVIMWELDNWPVFWRLGGRTTGNWWERIPLSLLELVEYAMTFIVLFVANILGWSVGIRAVERWRVPEDIWKQYVQERPQI